MDIDYAVGEAYKKASHVLSILDSEGVKDSVKISLAWSTQRYDKEFVNQVSYLGLHTNDFIIENNKYLESYTKVENFKKAYGWLTEQLSSMDAALG